MAEQDTQAGGVAGDSQSTGGLSAEALEKRLAAFEKRITSALVGVLDKIPAPQSAPQSDDPGPDAERAVARDGQPDPQVVALQRKLEKLEKERATERDRARAAARDGAVRDALGRHGIGSDRIPHALAYLQASGRVAYRGDSEELIFTGHDGLSVPLSDGLSEWARSDEASIYRPPTGASGAGTRPADGSGRAPERKKLDPDAVLRRFLNG